ncbi:MULTISPECIES: VWA domain-containing protein [unclassified Chelatococcus]|uniref:VWA domain-containing protein n=1 Tax=unclassified Chelatococcus TaxID=2638111 RepID=UPI001BCB4DFF|nr:MULTISPECIES: VWA domain-containing protein [unclassified Chelatococcus]MBS7698379.1 VWA domain-containing protein [Chelatococcus sp. YT9]MBX3558854.1 VWA domain-containing protein [Chelatococcus sp.]
MTGVFADFHFLRPWWLTLLVPAAILGWTAWRSGDTTARWRAVIDPDLLRHLTVGGEGRRRIGPGLLLLLGWVCGILAVAGPTWRQVPSPFAAAARPALFVLKVTPSMLVSDLQPSRLDRARQKMADLMKLREGAPTGLVAYAGSAHLVLPPTADGDVVLSMADALAPAIMPREGDALGEALALAARVLADGKEGGSIVVFADAAPTVAPVAGTPPVTLFAMLPPERADAAPDLKAAAATLGADFVTLTLDNGDVEALARSLKARGDAYPPPGEGQGWQEAGFWLTPIIALLALGWFRRGWVLP